MKTYDLEDLKNMTPKQRLEVFLKAVKVTGTAVVKDKDGNPKYDEPERRHEYGELDGSDT